MKDEEIVRRVSAAKRKIKMNPSRDALLKGAGILPLRVQTPAKLYGGVDIPICTVVIPNTQGVMEAQEVTLGNLWDAIGTAFSCPGMEWFHLLDSNPPKGASHSSWTIARLVAGETVSWGETGEAGTFNLTLEHLVLGYVINMLERPHDPCATEGDAITGSCILQYALFGEIVYG